MLPAPTCWQLVSLALTVLSAKGAAAHFNDSRPHPDSTGNLIFHSLSSLLQQWPNTKYKNGHAIIPGTIAPGTMLYHGRVDGDVPITPEWLAFEPDFSYVICYTGTCQMLSFATTRELRILFFDGSSGAKLPTGSLDTQDILFWGSAREDWIFEEVKRIEDACKWGKSLGIDGFVRTQMNVELMMCDFSNGLKLISNSSIVPPDKPTHTNKNPKPNTPPMNDPKLPVGWKGDPRSFASICFEVIKSGSWNNRPPGERRVQLDYSGYTSFFDPALKSLVSARRKQSREEYRPANASAHDLATVRSQVAEIATRTGQGSGVDWRSIAQVVVDRYGDRLVLLKHLLHNRGSRNISEQVSQVRSQVLIMLTPYMLTDAIPLADSGSRTWIAPIAHHCASTLTSWAPAESMTREEWLIKDAIDQVLHEICRVVTDIWLDAFGVEESSLSDTLIFIEKWKRDVEGLMTWLDWAMWDTCNPACGPEELCYLPTWPWVRNAWGWYPGDGDDSNMSPRCILAVEPYPKFLDA